MRYLYLVLFSFLFFGTGCEVNVGDEGVRVKAPGIDINVNDENDSVSVKAPGVDISVKDEEVDVEAPGVDVEVEGDKGLAADKSDNAVDADSTEPDESSDTEKK